jgi:hypothetical protein
MRPAFCWHYQADSEGFIIDSGPNHHVGPVHHVGPNRHADPVHHVGPNRHADPVREWSGARYLYPGDALRPAALREPADRADRADRHQTAFGHLRFRALDHLFRLVFAGDHPARMPASTAVHSAAFPVSGFLTCRHRAYPAPSVGRVSFSLFALRNAV